MFWSERSIKLNYFKVIIQFQNGNEVLNRLVPYLKCIKLDLLSTPGQFEPVLNLYYVPQVP